MTMVIDGSNGLKFPDNTNQQTAIGRNRLINGSMMIDQRNAGASTTQSNAVVYDVDRWYSYGTVASKFTLQQVADAPAGFKYSIKATSSSAYTVGASEQFIVSQAVEGYNYADMMYGTSSASTATLSFWVKSSLTGTFGGGFGNATNTRSYSFTYTINSANTWEYKTVTFTGDLTGTWDTTNGQGIVVNFSMGTGSTYQSTVNTWAAGNFKNVAGSVNFVSTNAATWQVTGVQLEKGSTATSFDYRPYGTELQLCQRYYYKSSTGNSNDTIFSTLNADNAVGAASFPVTMRTTPTLTARNSATDNQLAGIGTSNWTPRGFSGATTDRFRTVNPSPANSIPSGTAYSEFNFVANAEL